MSHCIPDNTPTGGCPINREPEPYDTLYDKNTSAAVNTPPALKKMDTTNTVLVTMGIVSGLAFIVFLQYNNLSLN